jgi:hypothetical protein
VTELSTAQYSTKGFLNLTVKREREREREFFLGFFFLFYFILSLSLSLMEQMSLKIFCCYCAAYKNNSYTKVTLVLVEKT